MKKRRAKVKTREMFDSWLYGWKDIASYVRCDEKTLRRWEKNFAFPIMRPANGRPMAHPKRVDEWIESFKEIQKR